MILNTLTQDELSKIKYLDVSKNKILFEEDSICEYIGIVVKGEINIISYSYNGKEIVYSTIKENQLFGNNLIFSSSPFYKGNVIAKVDSKLALLSKDDLITLLQSNKDFLKQYMTILNNNTKNLNEKIKILSLDSASDRLLYFLYKNNNTIKLNSVTALANKLFVRRETLSRTISSLVKSNIIEFNNNEIKLK